MILYGCPKPDKAVQRSNLYQNEGNYKPGRSRSPMLALGLASSYLIPL